MRVGCLSVGFVCGSCFLFTRVFGSGFMIVFVYMLFLVLFCCYWVCVFGMTCWLTLRGDQVWGCYFACLGDVLLVFCWFSVECVWVFWLLIFVLFDGALVCLFTFACLMFTVFGGNFALSLLVCAYKALVFVC